MGDTARGVGSFGAGLAKSLAGAYADKRSRERDEARRKEDRAYEVEKFKFQTMLPSLLENVEDVDDDTLASEFPTIFGGKQKANIGKTRGAITSALKQYQPGSASAGTMTDLDSGQSIGQIPSAPVDQGAGSVVMSDLDTGAAVGEAPAIPRRTLMGVPILSSEEKIERGIGKMESETTAKVDLAKRILPQLKAVDPSATMDDALAVVGIRTPSATARSTAAMRPQSVRGTVNGEPAFGIFDPAVRGYVYPAGVVVDGKDMSGQPIQGFVPLTSQDTQTFGVDREAISMADYGKPFRDLTTTQRQVVIQKEQQALQAEAKRRALGAGQGKFESPIDVKTSQETGTTVGSTSADYATQVVPNAQQQTRLRNATTIKQQLGSIVGLDPVTGVIDPSKSLLKALPTESDITGNLTPGAATFVRRRLPQHRQAFADLESAVNNIRASLTRTMQSNVGTETERDAERALTTLADFEGSLMDPLKGDTRESALRRFQQTLTYLDTVMSALPQLPLPGGAPGVPAPNAPIVAPVQPAGAPATTPTNRRRLSLVNGQWVAP